MIRSGLDLVHALGLAIHYVEDREYELYLIKPRTKLRYEVVYSKDGCTDFKPLHKFNLRTRAAHSLSHNLRLGYELTQAFRIITVTGNRTNEWIVWVDEHGYTYGIQQ